MPVKKTKSGVVTDIDKQKETVEIEAEVETANSGNEAPAEEKESKDVEMV
jgi:hypothetical protein